MLTPRVMNVGVMSFEQMKKTYIVIITLFLEKEG